MSGNQNGEHFFQVYGAGSFMYFALERIRALLVLWICFQVRILRLVP